MKSALNHWGTVVGLVGIVLSLGVSAASDANDSRASDLPTRWQLRLDLGPSIDRHLGPSAESAAPARAALLGDYDLGTLGLALPRTVGRFRASGGLLFGWSQPLGLAANQPWSTLHLSRAAAPYLGLGYSGWLPKSGLSFSADVGMTSDQAGSRWGFGSVRFGSQDSGDAGQPLRLQPLVRLGLQFRY